MALVQHRLDGIEQRCARRAKSVLQCPVGGALPRSGRGVPARRRADLREAARRVQLALALSVRTIDDGERAAGLALRVSRHIALGFAVRHKTRPSPSQASHSTTLGCVPPQTNPFY